MDYNEPILFRYHKHLNVEDYNGYHRKTYDLKFVKVLYGVHFRYAAKSLMYRYFDYCDKNDIEIFYCNIDSILIKEKDLNKMYRFQSKEHGNVKIDDIYNNGDLFVTQGKFILTGDDKTNNRNMEK